MRFSSEISIVEQQKIYALAEELKFEDIHDRNEISFYFYSLGVGNSEVGVIVSEEVVNSSPIISVVKGVLLIYF